MLISIFVYFRRNQDVLKLLKDVDIKYCVLLLPFIFLSFVIGSANLFILLKAKHKGIFWLKWFRFHFVKRFLNMHIPQSGNVYEAIKMREIFGIDILSYTASFGAVNWFNACFNCAIALVVLLAWTGFSGQINLFIIFGILFILSLLITVPPLIDYFCLRVGKLAFSGAVSTYVHKAHDLVRSMREDILDVHVFFKLLFWNTLLFCVGIATLFIGFKTLDVNIGLKGLIPFVVLSLMSGLVSILPGNIGIVEYAYGFLGSAFNLTISVGILLSLMFRIVTYVVFLVTFLVLASVSVLKQRRELI